MKKQLLILFALIGCALTSNAQGGSKFVNYERDNGWNLGFNMGATWQPREGIMGSNEFTKPYAGFGGGLTLGKSIYEKEGSFFALDLRGRYLGSYNAGWSGVPEFSYELTGDTTGASFGFRNYRMNLHEFSLEAVLTLNRLRERTGIILYGFGGIGATLNKVDADYRDFTGDHYNYYGGSSSGINAVDTSMNAQAIAAEVKDISDKDFETPLSETRFSLVPSWGVGFGYQIGPSFSMGVEYKLAYDLLGDEFDGGAANMLEDNVMDKYHYTGVFFRWNILSGGATYTVDSDPDPWTPSTTTPTTVVPTDPPVTHNKPLVNIYNPSTNNKVVHNTSYTIKAKIYHVETQSGVKFTQNGINISNFSFNPSTDEFTAQVYLYPGSNVFEITGTNPYGSDNDSRIIILEQEEFTQLPPPVVTFTNPAQNGMTVNQPQFTVVSNVLNVSGKNDITFTFNNQKTTNFTYSTSSKVLTSVVTLKPGKNVITVKGVNSVGSDIETVTINYEKPVTIQPPVVEITTPATNPYNTDSPVEVVNGTVHYVDGASDINVLVNGNPVTNFTYSTLTKKISFSANLIVGANVVQITGTNQFGSDAATTTIIYNPSEIMPEPIVEFIVPSTSPYSSPANNVTLKATVLNVTSKQYITVNVNGTNTTAFSYNAVTKEVSFNVNLINGNNIFKVTGTNSVGSDMDEQIIIHKLVEQLPPIVNITNPSNNPHNTTSANQVVNAEIQHVETVTGVTAKFNGQAVSNFTFDPVTDKFAFNASLQLGANVLEITGTNNVGTASKSQTIIYTQPVNECDVPVIDLTQPTVQTKTVPGSGNSGNNLTINTSNSKGAIVGKIEGSSSLDFKINGVSSPGYNYNSKTGAFETFLHLEEGANNYQIIATNNCGTTIASVTYIYTPEEQPCDDPVISWAYPSATPFDFTGPSAISLSASVLGVTDVAKVNVKLNGQTTKFVFDANTGSLSIAGGLKVGTNNVEVTARNECGTTTSTVVINYTKPVAPPTVTITNPAVNPYMTFDGDLTAKASVTGVDGKSQIQVYLDGQSVANFSYNASAKQVSVPLNLSMGSHALKVTATNPAGSAMDETEINVQEQCVDPVINLSQPTSGSSASITFNTSNSKGAIVATIEHASNITFKVNGTPSSAYNYNPATGLFECFLHLNEGASTYSLSATNNCNVTTEKVVTINYTPKPVACNEPVITFTNPTTNPYTSNRAKGVTISATVTEVSNANQIVCTVNGSTVQHSFNNASNTVSFTTSLLEGNNPVVITATNNCGSTTEDITVVFDKPLPKPEVEITTPAQDPYTTSSSNVLVKANILNVSGQNAITMKVDGQEVTNFTYSYTSKVLTSNLTLDNGSHTVVISGTNSAGSDQDQTVIEVSIPVTPPEVSIGNVTGSTSTNPFTAPSCTGFNVTGVVSNANASEITYTVDGITVTNVRTNALSASVVQFAIPVTFVQAGQVVTVTVTATTPDGTDTQTVYVTCSGGSDDNEGNDNNDDGGSGTINPGGGYGTYTNGGSGGEGEGGEGNGNGNNGHGNNQDGVDSSNPGQGGGGPNGENDPSGNNDDEGGNSGSQMGTVNPQSQQQKEEQEKTEKYNSYIQQADSYYNKKMYDEAYNFYQKATSVKPAEKHPRNRMTAIESIKQQQEIDAAYDAKIKKADLYFKAGKYSTAKTYYKQALSVKPNSSYAKSKIAEIDAKLKEINDVKKPTNTVKPGNTIIKPTNTGGKTNSSGGSKTNTNSGGSKTNTIKPDSGGSKTNTIKPGSGGSKSTTPKSVKPKTPSKPKSVTPTKIGGGR
ncbi:hypothetical protein [Parvicella tangerina]|uniref:Tetratricopeptide repeat protein n=1 Tax=Parvicella tangerina TaxID=2829795 RepID=A0A916JQL7_9FLAO|nr:hypothetical protein [Parvicella tangerina]CAG5087503.1 hypothetical protein CRYO30217_03499 [Parvicella tangerina]